MRKQIIAFSICIFVLVSIIPLNAFKVVSTAQENAETTSLQKVSVRTRTLSNAIIVDLAFPQPTVTDTPSYDTVGIEDLPKYGAPGEPVLPLKTVEVLLPQGKEMESISVVYGGRKALEGRFNVEYGKTPIPVGSRTAVQDKPDARIYGSSDPFPSTLFSETSVHTLRGYKILRVVLHPVQYIPSTGKLYYFETMAVTINLKETGEVSPMFRNLPQDKLLVRDVIINPYDTETYSQTTAPFQTTSVNPSESYQYVIITNEALNSSFQPLLDWKIQKGLNATTVLVEDILDDPDYFSNGLYGDGTGSTEFNGTAARIRNFIKAAYLNWKTEYVLLGGDTEIIPQRGVYGFVNTPDPPSPYTVDRQMPCDLYYGALDRSWNDDNDTVFGEGVYSSSAGSPENGTAGDEADFYGEVYIGRATVDTAEGATNFVNKTIWYERDATDDNYFKKAVMIGETLDETTEAGNSKDLATDIIPQYTTTRLYDRDGTFSRTAVISNLNNGPHIVNHDGHTNANSGLGLSKTDVDSLTNTDYFFLYSVGCVFAGFDGTGDFEAIAEHFIFNSHGAFALIGNSRYGWYIPGTTIGPGDLYDREFYSRLMQGEKHLGKALQLSKQTQLPIGSNAERWTYFVLNLLGDPETELVTDLMAPTAHFKTNPTASRLTPPVLKGPVTLTGIAKRGTAAGATFDNYTLQYGVGRTPTSWSTLGIELANNGESEVENDILGTWNSSKVAPNQYYTLRLRVYNGSDLIGEDRWIVRVEPLPTVNVEPTVTTTRVGDQTFTVEVNITLVKNLYELDIEFSWNTTLIGYKSHSVKIPKDTYPTGVLRSPVNILADQVNPTQGTYHIAAKSVIPAPTFDGSGTVFIMTFETLAAGTCILNITSSTLKNKYAALISHKANDGAVEIEPGIHDVAVIDMWVEKTLVCQGLDVDVEVTVENQGSFNETFTVITYANNTAINTTIVSLRYYSSTAFTFTWSTAGVEIGDYPINATASVVTDETDVADNTYTFGTVTIIEPVYDVAVLGMTFQKTIVGKGYPLMINVTVENQADLTSTFNLTVYADLDTAIIGDEVIVGLQEVTLEGTTLTIVSFTWDTTSVAYGNYTISAYASPLEAEADLEDNIYVGSWIIVTIPGDVDGDFQVFLYDAVKLLVCYGVREGEEGYICNYDIDGDGRIFLYDAVILCSRYGQKYP